jgi:hypothetical protein
MLLLFRLNHPLAIAEGYKMDSKKPMLASALKLSGSHDTDTYGAWTPANLHRHKVPTAQAPDAQLSAPVLFFPAPKATG